MFAYEQGASIANAKAGYKGVGENSQSVGSDTKIDIYRLDADCRIYGSSEKAENT